MILDTFKSKSKFSLTFGIFEIDTTFIFFFIGLLLGLIIFHNLKALFVFLLFVMFIVFNLIHDGLQLLLAKRFSLKLRKYILYPFGTKKFFGKDFDSPKQELIYGFAGLFVYFLIMLGATLVGTFLLPHLWPVEILLKNTLTAQTIDFSLISYPLFFVFWIAFLLFSFNAFIFAMPMDGGRLVKALLTIIFGETSANKIIPYLSKVVALIVILAGLFFWDILIVLIGLFIYYATMREFREYEILRVLEGKSIKTFMVKPDLLFKSDISVMDCFNKMRDLRIPDAIIELNDGYGVIGVEDISKLSKDLWPGTPAIKLARQVDAINVKENLAFVAQYMVAKDLEIMPVIEGKDKTIIGVIRRTDFADYIKIHRVL
jgi:hypothetical protein